MKANFFFLSIALVLSLAACHKAEQPDPRGLTALVSVEGSSTMTELVQAWAKAFMKAYPDVPVSVSTGGDSASGIAALLNRTTDLAAASRDLTDAELKLAHSKGIHLRKVTVARDAIVVIVNPANPLDAIALPQLKQMFNGQVNNWNAVGGARKPIHLYCREETSGTSSYFQEHVLQETHYSSKAKQIRSSEGLAEAISNDKLGIGYVGLGHAIAEHKAIKILKIKLEDSSPAVAPTQTSAIGAYPLSRPLIMFRDSNAKGSVAKFVDFCLSPAGQKVVAENGYVSMQE